MAPRKQTKKNANGEGGVYHRPDGRWETKLFVDMPDGRRKRISVYATSEREAVNELNKLRDQQRRGIPIATTTLTVADYITYWPEHIAEPSIRRTTYATYEGDVRLHIVPGIGKRKLKTLQAPEIRLWLNQLRTRCQCCAQGKDVNRKTPRCCAKEGPECCQDVLSSSSIRHVLRVLRAALQDAVDEKLLSRNSPDWFSCGSPMTEKSVASPGPRRFAFSKPPNSTGSTRSGRWPWRWDCVVAKRWVLPGPISTSKTAD